MPNIIDISFFVGEINVPNADKPGISENLELFIKKYQKRFLVMLLGQDVWKDFMDGLAEDPVESKWTELKAKFVDDDTKESPIANYVYYFYMRDGASSTTDVGETIAKTENSSVISPARKMVRAWNEMCDFVNDTQEWFHDYYATYNLNHDHYFFNLYCYHTYRNEFAKQNVLNL
jgi:L-rhamnose mutarotase